jgi:hypothetical protein
MWTNQLGHDNRFSIHNDGDPIGTWQPAELVSIDPSNGDLSDDHINIKTHAGHVYALTKTNRTEPTAPLVLLNHRNPAGTWTIHVVGIKSENHTRAVLALAPETDMAHVLATCAIEGRNRIFRKSTRLSTLVFPSGRGELFIDSPADLKVGNVSTSKHNVSSATGLLAIASDQDTRHYLHNFYATLPTTSVETRGVGADAPMTLGPAQPTPFRGSTRIPFTLREPARIELSVFDLHGRRVRVVAAGPRPVGQHAEHWDGRNDSGEPVSTGIYFARLASPGSATWQRLVRIR